MFPYSVAWVPCGPEFLCAWCQLFDDDIYFSKFWSWLYGFMTQDGQHHIIPQKLYVSSDNGMRSLSALSSISILPFSRLFLIGTEDGYLRICC